MFWITLLLAASSAGLSTWRKRSLPEDDDDDSPSPDGYTWDVCEESDEWFEPTRPCETLIAIEIQCLTGPSFDDDTPFINKTFLDCGSDDTCQSFEFERTCFCQSQFQDSAMGCYACYTKHGGSQPPWVPDPSGLTALMSKYCDPMVDPTAGFSDFYAKEVDTTIPLSTLSTKIIDSLGFKLTDVSLYYTPSLTGVEAWVTTLSTIEGWSDDAIKANLTDSSTSTSTRGSPGSTSFSSPTSTSVNTPTFYSTVYPSATASPKLVTNAGTSQNAFESIAGFGGILSFLAIVDIL